MKRCAKCSTKKNESEFYNQKKKDGSSRLSGYCRKCFRTFYSTPRNKAEYDRKRIGQIRTMKPEWQDKPNEVWVPIEGYTNYEVSNLGRIKAWKGSYYIIRIPSLHKHTGYTRISLSNEQAKIFYFHRVIAKAFIPNPNNLPEINHKDGVRDNNDLSNLEWVSHQQNMEHAIKVLKRHGSLSKKAGTSGK